MSHDAATKERLTVFLGAGAVAALGVVGTADVTKLILESEEARRRDATPIFEFVRGMISERYDHNVNFEHILHTLECLDNYYDNIIRDQSKFLGVESGAIEWTLAERLFSRPDRDISGIASTDNLGIDLRWVNIAIDILYKELRQTFGPAHKVASVGNKWVAFVSFLKRLQTDYHLDIVTTNYDRCVEEALISAGFPEPEHGFVNDTLYPQYGVFDGRRLQCKDGSRILHLHGSAQYSDRGVIEDPRGLYSQNRLPADQVMWWDVEALHSKLLIPGPTFINQAGESLRVGPMITGLRKPEKILAAEPYTTYYRLLSQIMQENSKLLIIGYGFGDLHINSLFMRMSHWHAQNRRIACISYLDKQPPGSQKLPEWCHNRSTGKSAFKWLSGVHDNGTDEFVMKDDSRVRVWSDRFMLRGCGFLGPDDPLQTDEVLGFLRNDPLSANYALCEPRTIDRSLR